MQQFQLDNGRPIYSLQEFLRVIAQVNQTFAPLIPDGIYGKQTQEVVESFQREYGLAPTGEVDNDTWDKIVEEYSKAIIYKNEPPKTVLFPSGTHIIRVGDKANFHYPIQSVIYALAEQFENIDSFQISNKHEGDVVETTKQLQMLMERNCNGEIDIVCWRDLSRLYENMISKDLFGLASLGTDNQNNMQGVIVRQSPPERYVDIDEITEDMKREQDFTKITPPGRTGVFTPRLDAYDIRSENNDQSGDANASTPQAPAVPYTPPTTQPVLPMQSINNSQMQNQTNDIARERENNNTDMSNNIVPNKNQSIPPTQQNPTQTNPAPKREPLRWDFK